MTTSQHSRPFRRTNRRVNLLSAYLPLANSKPIACSHGHHGPQPFPDHLAALEADGALCTEASADKAPFPDLRTDFGPLRQLCLVYPAEVNEPGSNYPPLAGLCKQLMRLVPMDIEVLLLVKSSQIAAELQKENFPQRIRYVLHSELKGIWLSDYAGFNMGSPLVRPLYKPKSYQGDIAVAQHISPADRTTPSIRQAVQWLDALLAGL